SGGGWSSMSPEERALQSAWTVIAVLGIGGLVYWMRRAFNALRNAVDAQKRTIEAFFVRLARTSDRIAQSLSGAAGFSTTLRISFTSSAASAMSCDCARFASDASTQSLS